MRAHEFITEDDFDMAKAFDQFHNRGKHPGEYHSEIPEQYQQAVLSAVSRYCLSGVAIYRGFGAVPNKNVFYIDPSNWDRKASNTKNLYNLWLNNSPQWASFPKRKLICTTSTATANIYGNSVWTVIPIQPNAPIGICPEDDLWDSFDAVPEGLNAWVRGVHEVFSFFNIAVRQENWEGFLEDCHHLDECLSRYETEPEQFGPRPSTRAAHFIKQIWENNGTAEYFAKLLDPQAAKFKKTDWHNFKVKDDKEVWLDTPCLLIKYEEWVRTVSKTTGGRVTPSYGREEF